MPAVHRSLIDARLLVGLETLQCVLNAADVEDRSTSCRLVSRTVL